MSECDSKGCGCAAPNVVTSAGGDAAGVDLKRSRYRIDNMDCPTEEALIRNKLATLPGVVKLEFNLMQRSLAVQHQLPSPAPIEQALSAIGMRPCLRRHHQRVRVVRVPRHRGSKRLHTGSYHPRSGGRPRQSSAHAALR